MGEKCKTLQSSKAKTKQSSRQWCSRSVGRYTRADLWLCYMQAHQKTLSSNLGALLDLKCTYCHFNLLPCCSTDPIPVIMKGYRWDFVCIFLFFFSLGTAKLSESEQTSSIQSSKQCLNLQSKSWQRQSALAEASEVTAGVFTSA